MKPRRAWSLLLAALVAAAALASSIASAHVRAEGSARKEAVPTCTAAIETAFTRGESAAPVSGSMTAVTTASPPAAITPVTPLPAPGSPASSGDETNNTAEYLVIGVVLGILAIVVAGLVVLWFAID